MEIIAADDENLALKGLEKAIKAAIPDCVLSCFTAPRGALLYAKEHRVDVAFLDIDMPGMSGLQLAKHLKEIYSQTNIVFTTGYVRFAADAFSMQASGYIQKPISAKAIAEAMEQLRYPVDSPPDIGLRVHTFGNFEVFFDGRPLHFAQAKTKELFAYLVSRQGVECSNKEIVAVIWEGKEDTPALQSQFRNLVADLTRILKSAGFEDALIKQRGYLAVAPDKFACDFYDFCNSNTSAVNKYTGEFMAQYSWAEFKNTYLETKAAN